MPIKTDTTVLRSHIKLALLREAFRQGLLTEAQLRQLTQQQ